MNTKIKNFVKRANCLIKNLFEIESLPHIRAVGYLRYDTEAIEDNE